MGYWASEFGDEYEVPLLLERMVDVGVLDDFSWHNDISPSFGTHVDITEIRIWVEHPDPEQREVRGPRFTVDALDTKTHKQISGHSTDDLEKALEKYFEAVNEASNQEGGE